MELNRGQPGRFRASDVPNVQSLLGGISDEDDFEQDFQQDFEHDFEQDFQQDFQQVCNGGPPRSISNASKPGDEPDEPGEKTGRHALVQGALVDAIMARGGELVGKLESSGDASNSASSADFSYAAAAIVLTEFRLARRSSEPQMANFPGLLARTPHGFVGTLRGRSSPLLHR